MVWPHEVRYVVLFKSHLLIKGIPIRPLVFPFVQLGPMCPFRSSDSPFCGQRHFKPCASIAYARTMFESTGAWITYQMAAGTYYLSESLIISSPFVTIEGPLTGAPAIIQCHDQITCIIVNGPSFRAINIKFQLSTLPISVNSS
jgi:hypothetical protein